MRSSLLIVVIGSIVYSNSIYNGFHYDDIHSIVENFHIRDIDNWSSYFVSTEFFSVDINKSMYRPVLLLTYGINYALGGYDVTGYHVFNVLIHICNSLLLRAVVIGLGYSSGAGLLAGVLFVVHPLTTEPVNYISSRSDSLAAMFYLGAFWCYMSWCLRDSCRFLIGFLTCLFLALLSKSSAMSIVLVIPIYDYAYNCNFEWRLCFRNAWKRYSYMFSIASLYVIVLMIIGFLGKSLRSSPRGLVDQFMTQVKALVFYLKLTFFPVGLNIDHQFFLGKSDQSAFWLSLLFIFTVTAIIFIANRFRNKALLFFPSWAMVSLLPVTIIPLNILVNERRIYMATAALCASLGIVAFSSRYREKLLILGSVCVLIFAGHTFQRNKIWLDEFSLWSDSIDKSPQGVRSYLYLGNAFKDLYLSAQPGKIEKINSWDDAIKNYQLAIEKSGGEGPLALRALNNLGAIHYVNGNIVEAERAYKWVVKLDPYYVDGLINLGTIFHHKGRVSKDEEGKTDNIRTSIDYYQKALGAFPNNSVALENIALAFTDIGRFQEAKMSYDRALFLRPNDPKLFFNFGSYHLLHGNVYFYTSKDSTELHYREAAKYMRKSLEIDPEHTRAKVTLEAVEKLIDKWEQ